MRPSTTRLCHRTLLLCALAPLRETIFIAVLLCAYCGAGFVHAENWDRFRGPNGAGQSEARNIPSEWKPENFLWQQKLPGVGHSSPVIWGGKLFVTSAIPETG